MAELRDPFEREAPEQGGGEPHEKREKFGDGRDAPSQVNVTIIEDIIKKNSVNNRANALQLQEIIRQLEGLRAVVAPKGLGADVKVIDKNLRRMHEHLRHETGRH